MKRRQRCSWPFTNCSTSCTDLSSGVRVATTVCPHRAGRPTGPFDEALTSQLKLETSIVAFENSQTLSIVAASKLIFHGGRGLWKRYCSPLQPDTVCPETVIALRASPSPTARATHKIIPTSVPWHKSGRRGEGDKRAFRLLSPVAPACCSEDCCRSSSG